MDDTSTSVDGNGVPVCVSGSETDVMVPGTGTCSKCHVSAVRDGAAMYSPAEVFGEPKALVVEYASVVSR